MSDAAERYPFEPDWCMRPGVHLAEEIECLGVQSPKAMPKLTGLTDETIAGVLDGSVEITEPIAAGLARAFGTSRLWLALEHNYRAALRAGLTDISDVANTVELSSSERLDAYRQSRVNSYELGREI